MLHLFPSRRGASRDVPQGIVKICPVLLFAISVPFSRYQVRFRITTGWVDEKNTDVDYIRVYVYNENQGLKTFLLNPGNKLEQVYSHLLIDLISLSFGCSTIFCFCQKPIRTGKTGRQCNSQTHPCLWADACIFDILLFLSIKDLPQMYVPNNVKSFGSASHEFKVRGCSNVHVLSVEQTQWKYLDKPSQRCTKEKRPNTTACIAEFIQGPDSIENEIGLSCDLKTGLRFPFDWLTHPRLSFSIV